MVEFSEQMTAKFVLLSKFVWKLSVMGEKKYVNYNFYIKYIERDVPSLLDTHFHIVLHVYYLKKILIFVMSIGQFSKKNKKAMKELMKLVMLYIFSKNRLHTIYIYAFIFQKMYFTKKDLLVNYPYIYKNIFLYIYYIFLCVAPHDICQL